MRILFIITGLNTGGAERALFNLFKANLNRRFNCLVICLSKKGNFGSLIENLGVTVYYLNMSKFLSLKGIFSLVKITCQFKPHLIQGWMYHANILSSILNILFLNRFIVIWNIRHSLNDINNEKYILKLVIYFSKFLSFLPDNIIYNSQVSLIQHKKFGFHAKNSVNIPNGVDLELFNTCTLNKEFHFPWYDRNIISFVHIARFHPMKDHACFIDAAILLLSKCPNVHFVLIGKNISESNPILTKNIPALYKSHFHFLGECSSIESLLPSFNCLVLSSAWGEAFPNVLIEAMSVGVPCITTDIGDSSMIVGNTGFVVSPKNKFLLSNAMCKFINLSKNDLKIIKASCRKRVLNNYSINSVVKLYINFYLKFSDNY